MLLLNRKDMRTALRRRIEVVVAARRGLPPHGVALLAAEALAQLPFPLVPQEFAPELWLMVARLHAASAGCRDPRFLARQVAAIRMLRAEQEPLAAHYLARFALALEEELYPRPLLRARPEWEVHIALLHAFLEGAGERENLNGNSGGGR